MPERRAWSEEDLLVAMYLYCLLPFGKFHSRHPQIIEVAHKLGRTPSALAMKLSNMASLDPRHQERGISGLGNASEGDRRIWKAFESDWGKMVAASASAMQRLNLLLPESEELEIETDLKQTTRDAVVAQRRGQAFFRRTVMTSYQFRCCITGNPIPELLTASHILPWKDAGKDRLNPRNGLCLAKTQDAAFDRYLITLDENLRLVMGPAIRDRFTSGTVAKNFQRYEGKPITLPDRFVPDERFLATHRERFSKQGT